MDKETFEKVRLRAYGAHKTEERSEGSADGIEIWTPFVGRYRRYLAPYKLLEEAEEVIDAWHELLVDPGSNEKQDHFLSELLDTMGVIQLFIDANPTWYTAIRRVNATRTAEGKTTIRLT